MNPPANEPAANETAQRFNDDLNELRLLAGGPSYSALEKASKHELKRATVSDRLNGKRAGLPDWPFVFAFVSACRTIAENGGLDLENLGTVADWNQHWDSAKRGVISTRFPGRSRQQASSKPSSVPRQVTAEIPAEPPGQLISISPRQGRAIWGPVPPPINDFVGREHFLAELHEFFRRDDRTSALAVQGAAGIGKTQLAAEFARRHRSEFDLVWWISCATRDDALRGMSDLASRLGVPTVPKLTDENRFTAVFDRLRLSRELARWLLIFDGADDLDVVRKLVPAERQNVLITSRNFDWNATSRRLELDAFQRSESVEFLLRRRRDLREAEAQLLADALGDFPLALEHAVESPYQVAEYLNRLESEAISLFSGNPPSVYPETIAQTWHKMVDKLRTETPDAMALLRCMSVFGPDPIPRDALVVGGHDRSVSLHQVLRDDVRFILATGALRRIGVLSVKPGSRPATSMFHVHRLTQWVVMDALSTAEEKQSRHDVHLLLAAATPTNPENSDSWVQYEELRGHIGASDVLGCQDENVRLLVVNFVRYLCAAGDPKEALRLARNALTRWSGGSGIEALGSDAIDLAMYRAEVEALCFLGSFDDAFQVCRNTLGKMRSAAVKWREEIAALGRITGTRLRKEGDFASALAADKESMEQHIAVFGRDHPQTFMAMHNLSVDHALNGQHSEAVDVAADAYRRCLTFYGHPEHPSTLFQQNALARCQRLAGNYDEALATMNEVNAYYRSGVASKIIWENHPWLLLHRIDFAAAQRDAGSFDGPLERLAEEVHEIYSRCWQALGESHPLTLAATVMRGSLLRRIPGQVHEADRLTSGARRKYGEILGHDHPYAADCRTLLASIRRQLESAEGLRMHVDHGSDFTPLPL